MPHHVIEEPEMESVNLTPSVTSRILPSPLPEKTWDPRFEIPAADR